MAADRAQACTTILVGRAATGDGSVLMATSCDGGIMGRVYALPATEYPRGNTVPMLFDFPAPSTWQEHLERTKRGQPFVWREVYGVVGERGNSLREWAALNALAPSLHLRATDDPRQDRYPFSVKPDTKVNVRTLTGVMRDWYQGTKFDVTGHPAFRPGGKPSPLARPLGSRDLFDLLSGQTPK